MSCTALAAVLLTVVLGDPVALTQAQSPETVILRGQVTCSECWFEADRSITPYGGDADTKCAIRCAKGGIPGALAVTAEGKTTLYILESGKYELGEDGKNWTDHTARTVKVTGTIRAEDDKLIVRVDSLEVLSEGS